MIQYNKGKANETSERQISAILPSHHEKNLNNTSILLDLADDCVPDYATKSQGHFDAGNQASSLG